MRWKGRRVSSNVEDRRGGGAKAGGISIVGLIVAFVAWKFSVSIHNRLIKPPSRSLRGIGCGRNTWPGKSHARTAGVD